MRIPRTLAGFFAAAMIAAPAFGADAPEEEDSPFKIAAHSLSELHLLKLQAQVAEARKAAEAAEPKKVPEAAVVEPPKARLPPAKVIEIGGAAGKFVAVIRLPDGKLVDFTAGQSVPGLGRIRILPDAVEDAQGRRHAPEPGDE